MDWNQYFIADFEAGTLTWKSRAREHFPRDQSWKVWNTRYADKIAGCMRSDGYRLVSLFGKRHLAHRILWEMAHGPIPEGLQIDHIDQNKCNGALINLRLATNQENSRNTSLLPSNTSGVKGVYWHKRDAKWQARIRNHGRKIDLGRFTTKGLAAVAYAKASIRLHGQFSTFTQ